MLHKTLLGVLAGVVVSFYSNAQGSIQTNEITGGDRLNTITTAVPFLMIAPDSRAGAMGDAAVATSPDANSMHWNASKLAFVEDKYGLSLSYTPWLRNLVPDISLTYMSGFYNMSEAVTLGMSIKYFSLGDIQFTDEFGNDLRTFNPNEFSINGGVAAKLARDLSGGFSLKYIHSNLTGGIAVQGSSTKPGQMVAADLSVYYQNDRLKISDRKAEIAAGLAISNIGGKISYSNSQQNDFLPINMRIGPRFTYHMDDYNKVSINFDLNKLLVPTPPIYKTDATGAPITDGDNFVIGAGRDPDRPVVEGMFTSFNDAPGNPLRDEQGNYIENDDGTYKVEDGSVLREELREINWGAGIEYWYDDLFAIRTGYFWEHELKGNRKYFNLGAGLRYNVFGLDFSYLIPAYFGNSAQQSPLQNTLRFTLLLNFAEDSANRSGNSSGTQGASAN